MQKWEAERIIKFLMWKHLYKGLAQGKWKHCLYDTGQSASLLGYLIISSRHLTLTNSYSKLKVLGNDILSVEMLCHSRISL